MGTATIFRPIAALAVTDAGEERNVPIDFSNRLRIAEAAKADRKTT